MDKKYCVFGDSVTQASYIESGWADLLRQYLEQKYESDTITFFNLGINGNTSDDILKRFKTEAESRTPTDFIFAFGVNDSGYFRTLDKPIVLEEKFVQNIESLIKEAKEISSNITFVGLTLGDDSLLKPFPESSKGKSYDTSRVVNYDKRLKELADANSCRFVSLAGCLRSEDFMDGLHPNSIGHRKMFEVIKRYF